MNIKTRFLLLIALLACIAPARAMTNAFTYQGRLSDANGPANDVFSMIFVLHDHPTEGDGIGVTVLPEVPVSNGLFTAQLAFPPQQLNDADRWLAVHVRHAADTNSPLTELTPRQFLTPAPYALMAKSVPDGAITAQHIAPGAVGATQLASNAVTGAITPGTITSAMLAPGAAASNLAAQNQSAVGSGGMILSEDGLNTNLVTAGYVKIGKVELVPEKLEVLADPPANAGSLRRTGHSVIWTGTEYIIWGGRTPNNWTPYNDGIRYNPTANTWTYITSSNAPGPRYDHHAVWTGTEMIIFGGSGNYSARDAGARFNPITGAWTLMGTNNAPSTYPGSTAVWANGVFLVWGGYSLTGTAPMTTHYHNTGGRYNPANDTWLPMPAANTPAGRYGHRTVWTGTEMIVWGGIGEDGYLADGGRYHPLNNQWFSMAAQNAPGPRWNHSATWTGTEMIVWGGSDGLLLFDGGRYNPANNTWSPMSTANGPNARASHSAVWTGSRLVIWGGFIFDHVYWDSYTVKPTDTGGIYNPASDTWTPASTLNAPGPHGKHDAVWTGSRMLVWDAVKLGDQWNESGGRFDPVANSWTAMAPTGDVIPREDFTSIWTGSELLIWGGQDAAGNVMRSGLRFDPIRNQWNFMTLAGSPDSRKNALAVWTGTEMIVWGGEDATGTKLRTGGRYNPATDSWIPLPSENSPSQRTNGTAVWAGGHCVVWGGKISSFLTSTGGRFNPTTGQWQSTALPPAGFLPRQFHTAVSIGDAMLVWGGQNGTNHLDDGALYWPATDTWALLPQTGAPSARAAHTAVWNGTEMIVFGGWDGSNTLRTGGRFNPVTGVWTPTSAAGATQFGRSSHRAVWAYDRMITVKSMPLIHHPRTDSWTEGTVSTDPKSADAFWTGAEVLWWTGDGGCQSYSPARTTYLYTRP